MDGAIYENNLEVGYKVIFWDLTGKVTKALTGRAPSCRSSYLAELLGCRSALQYVSANLNRPSNLEIEAHNITTAITA